MSEETEIADKEQLESFERAFSNSSSCRWKCNCGKVYWDTYNSCYDWEEGETEALQENPNAIGVPHSVGVISCDGCEFVDACDCWHKRASRIIGWLEANRREVVAFLRLERDRKMARLAKMLEVLD